MEKTKTVRETDGERIVRIRWNKPQTLFLRAKERYVDFEGAVRAGKTTPLVWKIITYCQEYPGIHCMLSRWTGDALDAQLRPKFYDECPPELLGRWNDRESFQEFINGSRVYLRALKTSDARSRYAKFAGLTLAVIGVDQPEEVPEDVMVQLKARLSQKNFPQQMLITPNPPSEDHWISDWFPEDGSKPGYRYIHTAVYDNVENLGQEFIDSLLLAYPPKHPLRRRFIEGKRGLMITGDGVYADIFDPVIHVREVEPLAGLPILEGWDFGHRHPAVVWVQITPDQRFLVLGEYMGESLFIDEFAPLVMRMRPELFPVHYEQIWSCCDPSGAEHSTHGMRHNPVDVLGDFGVFPVSVPGSNSPPKRDYSIQTISRLMLRRTQHGMCFQVHPRCRVLIDGFQAGYVWAERSRQHSMYPNIRHPLKDGFYDHLQNALEYIVLNYGQGLTGMDVLHDLPEDEDDAYNRFQRSPTGRAGY